jgi:tetratricopeptide (TPR) repeat protein
MPDVAVASLEPRLQKLVESARVAFERGNLDDTVELCTEILGEVPGCFAVRKLRRATYLRRHQGKSRLARVLGTVSTAPFLFGAGAAARKEPARAVEAAEKILATDPNHIGALRLLGQATMALGWPETAVFAYEAIREQAPADASNLVALGEAVLAAGRAAEAVKVAEAVLRVEPANGSALNLLRNASVAETMTHGRWEDAGSYRGKLKDEEKAVSLEQSGKLATSEAMAVRLAAEARERLAHEPDNLNHYRNLALAYRGLGQFEEAIHWVQNARKRPGGGSDEGLERLESELRLADLAARLAALEAGGGSAEAVAAAREQLARQRLADAHALVEKFPNDHAARLDLGNLLLAEGQLDGAIAQFQQAQRGPKVRVAALVGLGRCFRQKGLFDLAVTQFEAARSELGSLDETKKEVVYELGLCREAMGQGEQAMAEFKTIYAADIGYRDVAAKIDAFYAKK